MLKLGFMVFESSIPPGSFWSKVFVETNVYHYEVALFFFVILLMVVVSSFTKKVNAESIRGLYLGSATPEQRAITRASWSNWDLVNSAIVIAVVIAFYAYFW